MNFVQLQCVYKRPYGKSSSRSNKSLSVRQFKTPFKYRTRARVTLMCNMDLCISAGLFHNMISLHRTLLMLEQTGMPLTSNEKFYIQNVEAPHICPYLLLYLSDAAA